MKRTSLGRVLACGVAVLLTGAGVHAQTTLYGVGVQPGTNTPSTFTIDKNTGADSPVGALGDAATLPFGLAVSGGNLYTFDGNTDQIRRIDPFTGSYKGAGISIGSLNLTGEGDIAFGLNGVGYITTAGVGATGNSPGLYAFNIGLGSSNFVASTQDAEGLLTVDGLAFSALNNSLYAITAEDDRLYTLDANTGFLTPVGTGLGVSPGSGFAALTFDSGILYGIINDQLYSINPTSGVATAIGLGLDYGSVSGLAGAIPEPSSVGLAVVAGATLLLRRQRPTMRS